MFCRECFNTHPLLSQCFSRPYQPATISLYVILRDDKLHPNRVLFWNSLWLRLSIFFICFRETSVSFSVNGLILSWAHFSVELFILLISFKEIFIWVEDIFSVLYYFFVFVFSFSFWVMQKKINVVKFISFLLYGF